MKQQNMAYKFIALTLLTLLCTGSFAKEVGLKEKIGQMLIIGFKGNTLEPSDPITQSILAQETGGVILFDQNFQTKTFDHNIQNPIQLRRLTEQLQNYAKQAANKKENDLYPLFIGIDYEGGMAGTRLKEEKGFPKTITAEAVSHLSLDVTQRYAQEMASTLKNLGINLNFAPVVDVNINPENPIISKLERSFSSNAEKVIDYARIFSNAYQHHEILCAYKHFPGHGSSTGDTHKGFVDITNPWKKEELEPYKVLLKEEGSCPMVMVSHLTHYKLDPSGRPASLSLPMIDLLRKELNFKGVIVTDDMQMSAIAEHYGQSEAIRLAINAGSDLLVFANQLAPVPVNPKEIVEGIYQDVKQGKIPENRIHESFQRIMKLKAELRSENKIKHAANTQPNFTISGYQPTFIPTHNSKGALQIAIRAYSIDKVPYFLIVNPYTFETKTLPAVDFLPQKSLGRNYSEVLETPYIKSLFQYTSPPYKLENYGIKNAASSVTGMFLTVDMCPSTKPFESAFFQSLIEKSEKLEKPIPVGIAVTGLWMIGHPDEFKWLVQQRKSKKLEVTWINHSFSHIYYKDLPSEENFLLSPFTHIESEILNTEKMLLENGETPSIFFRFPGLISNEKLILKLRQFGLIPIGSNAWLAKNEAAKPGSIILVHGNSNEPSGIEKMLPLMKEKNTLFLPLGKAFYKK